MAITTCIFDAYGTLFDVSAAARQLAERSDHVGLSNKWQALANHWRHKQLQYSWLRAVMDEHCDFWQVTQDGLDWALEATELSGNPNLREDLLALYWDLAAYPEVPDMLDALKGEGLATGILSNGSPDMLSGAVNSAGLQLLLDKVISVQDVGIFKPARSVYDLVGAQFDVRPDEVLFVSSNGWDAAAAAHYGFHTVWVNRAQEPVDRLPWVPETQLADLTGIPELAVK